MSAFTILCLLCKHANLWYSVNMVANLSLYAVNAFVVLDTDGHRVMAKYYNPKSRGYLGDDAANKGLNALKEQRAFEKGLFAKTKKAGGASSLPASETLY